LDDNTQNREIEELEGTVKDLLKNISEIKLEDELSNLENKVESVLTELSDLEQKLPEINKPGQKIPLDNNYIMASRRFQNAMQLAILDGVRKRDIDLLNQGFEFYKNAVAMTSATGNLGEVEQVRKEFAEVLFKVLMMAKEFKDDKGFNPFLTRICQGLAEFYEYNHQYDMALKFHARAGYLLNESNPLLAEVEYFASILDHLMVQNKDKAEKMSIKLNIKHIKLMAEDLLKAFNEKDESTIEKIKKRIEVLGVQRRFDTNSILYLLDSIKNMFKKISKEKTAAEIIQTPAGAIPLSNEMLQSIQNSLAHGIQQFSEAYPNIQIQAPQIDTKSIVEELKVVISNEISKEIKSLSTDIVNKILSSIPSGVSMGGSRPHSGGTISDDAPDIQIVATAPTEKPERPKLDDMLDSIIVCE